MLCKYQLLTADFYNILMGHAKKLVSNFFDKEKKSASKWKLGLKLKKIHRLLEFNQSQCLKPYIELNTQ